MLLMIRAGTGQQRFAVLLLLVEDAGRHTAPISIATTSPAATPQSCASASLMTPEPGNMVGPTTQGIDDLIAQDPDAYWDHVYQLRAQRR